MAKKITYLTQEGYDQLVAELNHLIDVDRPQNIEALKEARAQGDLSENAEYDAARDEQARIENRIKELEQIIKNAIVIDGDKRGNNLGKKITIRFNDGFVGSYTLVGTLESDPLIGTISNESPVGRAIISSKVGDKVLIKSDSDEEYTIEIVEIE